MEDMIEAAKAENWKYIDQIIPKICDDPEVQKRFIKLLRDSDGNVRDLGASIIVKAKISPRQFSNIKPVLKDVMDKDSNPYARYRAAFAFVEHGMGSYEDEVLRVLNEASKDKEVSETAENYLKRLGK